MADENWPKLALGELTKNFDSIRVPVREASRRPGPYPYYGASGIVDYVDGYLFDGLYLLIAEDGENLRTLQTPVAFLASGRFWVNNHAHIVQGNGRASTLFLRYAISQTDISGYLTGSTMPKLTQANMNRIPVIAPPPNVQEQIVRILGALDDKIEVNRRMNETLEAIAQALFKSWFVDFDPVRVLSGQKPEKPPFLCTRALKKAGFSDRFQASEFGEIPEGWGIAAIRELSNHIQYGLTQSASIEPVGPRFLRITDIQGGRVDWSMVPYCRVSPDEHERYQLKPGDILVARTGASTGENIYLSVVPDAVFASYLVRFQFADPAIARLVGAFMRTAAYFEFVAGSIGGSAQPNASAQVLAGAELVLPTPELARRFADIVASIDRGIVANCDESHTLAALRDAVLPELLSGELRLKDAEKLVEVVE